MPLLIFICIVSGNNESQRMYLKWRIIKYHTKICLTFKITWDSSLLCSRCKSKMHKISWNWWSSKILRKPSEIFLMIGLLLEGKFRTEHFLLVLLCAKPSKVYLKNLPYLQCREKRVSEIANLWHWISFIGQHKIHFAVKFIKKNAVQIVLDLHPYFVAKWDSC